MYFQDRKITDSITMIEDLSVTKMYLIEGTKKAVLIDTGVGFKGLREHIEQLTDLPLEVVISHGHLDHAGGVTQFEKVWYSPEDLPLLEEALNVKQRMGFAKGVCEKYCSPDMITENDFSGGAADLAETVFLDLKDRQEFDLGGRCLKVIRAPGHTQGICVFYDDLSQSLFVGDACNPSSYLFLDFSTTIEDYLKSVKKLESWMPVTSHYFFQHDYGHITDEGPGEIITDVRECCEKILSRTDAAVPFYRDLVKDMMKVRPLSANELNDDLMRTDGRLGNVIYAPDHIFNYQETISENEYERNKSV